MEELKDKHQDEVGTKIRSVESTKLQNKAKYWRAKGYDKIKPDQYKNIIRQLKKSDSIMRNDSYVRIHYVRYADDFVVGVIGSYTLTKQILQEIESFVNERLKLTFNAEKTGIIDLLRNQNTFKFLGFKIKAPFYSSKKGIKPWETVMMKGKTLTRRKKTRAVIDMEIEKVLKKLSANGFIRKRTSHANHPKLVYRGAFKGNLINLNHPDILKYYNSVVRGIQNYYSFAKNRVSLA